MRKSIKSPVLNQDPYVMPSVLSYLRIKDKSCSLHGDALQTKVSTSILADACSEPYNGLLDDDPWSYDDSLL